MNKAIQVNFVSKNSETGPGNTSEGITEIMDSNENSVDIVPDMQSKYVKDKSENSMSRMNKATELNVVTENSESALGTTSEGVTEVIDSNGNGVDIVPDIQPRYINNKSKNAESKMDKGAEITYVTENPETVPITMTEASIEIADSNENGVDIVPNMQSKYIKNKSGNAKSKIQMSRTKKMTVSSATESKSLKRKATHPATSQMVMDCIKALKKRNGVSFEDIRKYIEKKYAADMTFLKHHVAKFLLKGVDSVILEKIDRGSSKGRFKIKKLENIKKDSKTMPRKERKMKSPKKNGCNKKAN